MKLFKLKFKGKIKVLKNLGQSIQGWWKNVKQVIRILKRKEEENGVEEIFKEVMIGKFLKIMKDIKIQI